MSLRSLGIATAILILLSIFASWPRDHQPEIFNKPPAPRIPASIPKKLDRVAEPVSSGKMAIRLPEPTASSPTPERNAERNERFIDRYRWNGSRGIHVSDQRFDFLRLKAITSENYRSDMGTGVDEKLGYVIFAARDAFGELSEDGTLPVVAKRSNGMLGIVTGTIIVRLRESALAIGIAENYHLTLKYIDDDLKVAYYSGQDSKTSLTNLVEALKHDTAVESVNLEIVNSKKRF